MAELSDEHAPTQAMSRPQLEAEVVRLNKIVQALMNRAERSTSAQGSDFSLFQTAILLEDQVRARTRELEAALHENAKITRHLEAANEELRQTQAQLVQSAKMAALGQLVAGVAHEINNPIAFVSAHRDTVSRQLDELAMALGELDSEQQRRLDKAQRRLADMKTGLDRVIDLVQKLRTFSRLDEGEIKTVDIHECLEAVLLLLHYRIKARIAIARDYRARGPVECYPGPLNQVLMNVLTNAVDAIGEQPGHIELHTKEQGEFLEVRVRDSGPGIAETVGPRLFEPFFTTKPVGVGTGLGLAISYRIMETHGGRIELHNASGGGAEAILRLPLRLVRRT